MNFKAAIFDLDGLLIDTETYWTKADNEILKREGFSLTPELVRKRLGTGGRATVEIYHEKIPFSYPIEDFFNERREMVFKMMDEEIPIMQGAIEFIEKSYDAGLKLAIATSGPHRERMPKILKALDAKDYVTAFAYWDDVKRHKPFPDIFILAAGRLGIKPEECLVIEDAPAGIEAAKAAKMSAYGVNKDEETRKQLGEKGADEVFSSLSGIDINKL